MHAQVNMTEDILHGTNAGLKNRWFTKFSGKIVHGNVYTNYGKWMLNGFMRRDSSMASGRMVRHRHDKIDPAFHLWYKHGIQKEWYDNGKLMRESDMKGDTLYCYHKEFYPSV